jgi:hypothetical protein
MTFLITIITTLYQNFGVKITKKITENFKKGRKQVSAKKLFQIKKEDVGMWVGSHPK